MKRFGAGVRGTDSTEAYDRNFLQHGKMDILVGAHSANGKGLEFKRVFTSITPKDGENYANDSQGIGSSN